MSIVSSFTHSRKCSSLRGTALRYEEATGSMRMTSMPNFPRWRAQRVTGQKKRSSAAEKRSVCSKFQRRVTGRKQILEAQSPDERLPV